ncbi:MULTISPECIES: dihydroxyacetone kinase subunit DhaL [Methylomicrobium]|uniref:Dihydroxyacetone kinase, phosphoprotein-dependent, L subunit n=1 Tax=Methylomicrobium album BG8 TaxID=686340 RepID=H8GRD8_METAL|nr:MULTISPECIES: dihydroxyacetone kinase subunit DhaL [Methylomicrobium]EIC31117.1 dihydroxyacetone kinase, phosphoprotein-dependent, L subunit [Methylomicrobium album BG8]
MNVSPEILPRLIQAVADTIEKNAEEVTQLDQAIGDGDHVVNLQRGIHALQAQSAEIAQTDWVGALQKIGMTLMSTVGGASGSLYGTLFVAMSKSLRDKPVDRQRFADAFAQGVESVKLRGRADAGEKTMLDVLIPAAQSLQKSAAASEGLKESLAEIVRTAEAGVEATRNMLATKGRASFLGERTLGHLDAGAKTAQLMISAIAEALASSAAPT